MARKLLLGFFLLAASAGGYAYYKLSVPVVPVQPADETRAISKPLRYAVASLAVAPAQPFPTAFSWEPLRHIGETSDFSLDEMLHKHPVQFMEMCLNRYDRNVQSYRCTFFKQERVKGELRKPEELVIHFREKPFSVHMSWNKGAYLVCRSLYVEKENEGKALARPVIEFLPISTFEPNCDQAKDTSRYPIDEFGLRVAMNRCLESMRDAQKRNKLHIKYEGLVTLKEVGNRPCYKFVRTPHEPLEEEGVNELILYFDEETLLQVGSVVKDAKGDLIGVYYFRDIEINPVMHPDQFTRKKL